jgi:hypothetical protein
MQFTSMNKVHIIVGDHAAKPLLEAISQDENLNGEILVLKDILHVGPLRIAGIPFSEARSTFWNQVNAGIGETVLVDDLERLMQLSTRLSNDEGIRLYFWMAPCPADVAAYFWLLQYLKKHAGRLSLININGLPFLDGEGKLFYPDSIGHLPVKEIIKAQKLSRVLTPSEWETDGEEWKKLSEENAGVRVLEGGKKLSGKGLDFYDEKLLLTVTQQAQKAGKLIHQSITKYGIPTGDSFLSWRLQELADGGKIVLEHGMVSKAAAVKEVE